MKRHFVSFWVVVGHQPDVVQQIQQFYTDVRRGDTFPMSWVRQPQCVLLVFDHCLPSRDLQLNHRFYGLHLLVCVDQAHQLHRPDQVDCWVADGLWTRVCPIDHSLLAEAQRKRERDEPLRFEPTTRS